MYDAHGFIDAQVASIRAMIVLNICLSRSCAYGGVVVECVVIGQGLSTARSGDVFVPIQSN